MAKVGSGRTIATSYLLDLSGNQITELNASGQWVHRNVFAGGRLMLAYEGLAGPTPNTYHFHLTNWLGMRRVLTDYAGATVQSCASLPFGNGENCPPTPTECIRQTDTSIR